MTSGFATIAGTVMAAFISMGLSPGELDPTCSRSLSKTIESFYRFTVGENNSIPFKDAQKLKLPGVGVMNVFLVNLFRG